MHRYMEGCAPWWSEESRLCSRCFQRYFLLPCMRASSPALQVIQVMVAILETETVDEDVTDRIRKIFSM